MESFNTESNQTPNDLLLEATTVQEAESARRSGAEINCTDDHVRSPDVFDRHSAVSAPIQIQ